VKQSDLKLGVELEVEILDDPNSLQQHQSQYVIYGSYPKHNNLGHIHHKHGAIIETADKVTDCLIETHYDNTINDGVEWIGKPMSLSENKKVWSKLLGHEKIAGYIHGEDVPTTPGNGYGIHDVGMHVHVSSKLFTPVLMGKLLVFINSKINTSFIEFIAGRKLNKFCSIQATTLKDGEILYHSTDCSRTSKRNGRITSDAQGNPDVYNKTTGTPCCVNAHKFYARGFKRGAIWVAPTLGSGDFEIRIFKSTVNLDRFNANLEFVVAITNYCEEAAVNELTYKDFGEWMTKLEHRLKYTSLFKLMRKEGYTEGIIPRKETVMEWIKQGKYSPEEIGVAA